MFWVYAIMVVGGSAVCMFSLLTLLETGIKQILKGR